MKWVYRVTLAVLFSLAGAAHPADIVRSYESKAGDVLVLSSEPCTTMKGIFADYPVPGRHPELKAAKMLWKGKPLDACWMIVDGLTMVIDETGDNGAIEGSPFDPKTGTNL